MCGGAKRFRVEVSALRPKDDVERIRLRGACIQYSDSNNLFTTRLSASVVILEFHYKFPCRGVFIRDTRTMPWMLSLSRAAGGTCADASKHGTAFAPSPRTMLFHQA